MRQLVLALILLVFTGIARLEGYRADSYPVYYTQTVNSYARELKETLENTISFRDTGPDSLKILAHYAGLYAHSALKGAAKPGYYAYRFNPFSIILRSIEQHFGSQAELTDNKLLRYTCRSIAIPAKVTANTISTLSAFMIYLGLPLVVIPGVLYGLVYLDLNTSDL